MTGGWACCIVTRRGPEIPVEAFLASPPPRRWRRGTAVVAVHGDPEPGGSFVVEFDDASLRASKSPARFAPWPPSPPHRFAAIALVLPWPARGRGHARTGDAPRWLGSRP